MDFGNNILDSAGQTQIHIHPFALSDRKFNLSLRFPTTAFSLWKGEIGPFEIIAPHPLNSPAFPCSSVLLLSFLQIDSRSPEQPSQWSFNEGLNPRTPSEALKPSPPQTPISFYNGALAPPDPPPPPRFPPGSAPRNPLPQNQPAALAEAEKTFRDQVLKDDTISDKRLFVRRYELVLKLLKKDRWADASKELGEIRDDFAGRSAAFLDPARAA